MFRGRIAVVSFIVVALTASCTLVTDIGDDFTSGRKAISDDAGAETGVARETGAPSTGCASAGGPALVRVNLVGGAYYCVDSTEVTRGQYLTFLESSPSPSTNPACAFKQSFVPGEWPPSAEERSLPVTNVDWCDAERFCAWAGKQLCGGIGGARLDLESAGDAESSVLAHACSAGGERKFPYGNTFEGQSCNVRAYGRDEPVPVGTLPRCEGGYPGIFDLVGNVTEWMSVCASDGNTDANDTCAAFNSPYYEEMQDELVCTFVRTNLRRSDRYNYLGFRCCGL